MVTVVDFFMKRNGFTLIELLVVVAIIGILAAVGVVAYNGYTASAKKAVVKQNHKAVVKWIQADAMKCVMNGGTIFRQTNNSGGGQNKDCSNVTDYNKTPFHENVLQTHIGYQGCLLYTSPSPRDLSTSRMPSSA